MKNAEHIRSGWMCCWVDKRQSDQGEALQNGKKRRKEIKSKLVKLNSKLAKLNVWKPIKLFL